MQCYRSGGCGPYENRSCSECPASKPEYLAKGSAKAAPKREEPLKVAKKFYISDWHYGHKNILAYDNRPFKSVEEMNKVLVDRWNNTVHPGDLVFVLGDMFWCTEECAIPILQSLNGTKILIAGNHDTYKKQAFRDQFAQIADYMEIKDRERNVVLFHYPIPCFKNHFNGWYHLYGHVHNSFESNMMEHDKMLQQELYGHQCNMFNVGAMMPWMDYTPRTLDEIIR